jgi:ketosteroid isomerase-like protein
MVDIDAEKKAIQKLIKDTIQAEDNKDLDKILNFFANDVIIHEPNAPQVQGIENIVEPFKEYLSSLVSISGESTHVEISSSGDMAWDVGYNISEHRDSERSFSGQGKYFAVYKKVGSKWKCAALAQSSNLPQPK